AVLAVGGQAGALSVGGQAGPLAVGGERALRRTLLRELARRRARGAAIGLRVGRESALGNAGPSGLRAGAVTLGYGGVEVGARAKAGALRRGVWVDRASLGITGAE